jgi:hypothetical protein
MEGFDVYEHIKRGSFEYYGSGWCLVEAILKVWNPTLYGGLGDYIDISPDGERDYLYPWEGVQVNALREGIILLRQDYAQIQSVTKSKDAFFDIIRARQFIGDGSLLTGILTGNVFNQVLNTTSSVTFNKTNVTTLLNLGCVSNLETGSSGDIKILCGTSSQVNQFNSSIKLYYDFDSWTGNTIFDLSQNGNNGTNTSVLKSPGRFGNALNCSQATTDYVYYPDSSSTILSGKNFTLSIWVNPLASQSNYAGLMVKDTFSPTHYGANLQISNTRAVYFITRHPLGGNDLTSSAVLPAGTWTLVTGVFNGTHKSIYFNDTLISSVAYTRGAGDSSGKEGRLCRDATNLYFNGLLDEALILDVALTPNQISQLFNNNPQSLSWINSTVTLTTNSTIYFHNGHDWRDLTLDTQPLPPTPAYSHPVTGNGAYTLYDSNWYEIAEVDEYGHITTCYYC